MNERFLSQELTAGRVSSTLNVRSTMPEPPKDQGPQPQKPIAEGSHRADGSDLDKLWRERARQSMTQGEVEARRILEQVLDKYRISKDSLANPNSEAFQQRDQEAYGFPLAPEGYKYDAYNMTNPDGSDNEPIEAEDRPSQRRQRQERRPRNLPEVTHPQLQAVIDQLGEVSPYELPDIIENVKSMGSADPTRPIPEKERAALVQALANISARSERIGLYLQDDDRSQLMVDPQGWMDKKFDLLYLAAQSGQELDSQVLQGIQGLVGEANQFLSRRFEKAAEMGDIAERDRYQVSLDLFNRTFATRINLLVGRVVIDRRSGMEQIAGAWGKLRAEGLIGSLSFDNARVGAMFNRMDEFLEDIRLGEGGEKAHLTTKMVSNMQKRIEEEQFQLAHKDVGVFAEEARHIRKLYKINEPGTREEIKARQINADEALRAEVRRAVRTAYDVFVNSQRLAIISARGRHLEGTDAYLSDPGGAFSFFNSQDLLIEKYGILNKPQREFMEYIQMDMAESEEYPDPKEKGTLTQKQLKERGKHLYRDLSAAPDFFSSSWRVKVILQQIEDVTRYKLENELIVDDLLKNRRSEEISGSEVLENFRDFMSMRLGAVDLTGLSEEQEARLKRDMVRDFVRGNNTYEDGHLISGLTIDQRKGYIQGLVSEDQAIQLGKDARIKAKDFALFMQIRQPGPAYEAFGEEGNELQKKAWRENAWKKVVQYKPEEIMRIVRERMDPEYGPDKAFLDKANAVFSEVGGSYDEFKKKYGAVIKSIREDGFREGAGRQINFGTGEGLTTEQKEIINKVMGGPDHAEKVIRTYGHMQEFINSNGVISSLTKSWRYEDLYTRTITVDDALLSDLEYVPQNSGLTRISQVWTNEGGADALQRNGNDFKNNEVAARHQLEVTTKESEDEILKASEAHAHATGQYNGPDSTARVFRYGYGSELRFGLQNRFVDVLQIGKLPFRLSSSKREDVRGPGMKPLTSEEGRGKIDHVMGMLEGSNDHGKYLHQLEKLLRADAASRMKDRLYGAMFYILLAMMIAPAAAAAKASGESIGGGK